MIRGADFQPHAPGQGGGNADPRTKYADDQRVAGLYHLHAAAQADAQQRDLAAQLGDDRAFVFGDDWTIADFSTYHLLWFIHAGGAMAEVLAAHPAASAWYGRMKAFGKIPGVAMTGQEALAVAMASTPVQVTNPASDLPGIPAGTPVDVGPTDYGVMPSRGRLLRCDAASITIAREHERTGLVHVHFPRHGFGVTRVRGDDA